MLFRDEKNKRFAANSIFPSLVYAVFGLALAQAGAAQIHGSWGLHLFLGIPGILLSGLVLFRARLHWSLVITDLSSSRVGSLGWYLLLGVAGSCIGALATTSALLLGIVAPLTYLLPWTRIPICRAQFFVSAIAILAGALAWVVIHGSRGQFVNFMIAAWMLVFTSMFMHLLVLVSLNREYRIDAPRNDESGLDPHAVVPR